MTNLKDQVISSATNLQSVWQKLASRPSVSVLPTECYKRWESAAGLHTSLSGTIPLFEIRENAWRVVKSLIDPKRIASENLRMKDPQRGFASASHNFSHEGIEMDFSCARHLALVSYASVSWSIYDRLTNICGRMAATQQVRDHHKLNPKLVEHLLAKERERSNASDPEYLEKDKTQSGRYEYGNQLFAFSMQYHLRSAYDWPTRVIYTIRNWLLHEGDSIGNVRLFRSDSIEDGLCLHSDAISLIENRCYLEIDGNGGIRRCCLQGAANPWTKNRDVDLISVLDAYHGEVDTMLSGLLKWCVESFVGQFAAFTARDMNALSAGATISNP